MSCPHLDALRDEAKQLTQQLIHQRAIARSTAHLDRGSHPPGQSDYEPLIKRKLERIAETIQRHKREHGCED
jgi:hypothetical protein